MIPLFLIGVFTLVIIITLSLHYRRFTFPSSTQTTPSPPHSPRLQHHHHPSPTTIPLPAEPESKSESESDPDPDPDPDPESEPEKENELEPPKMTRKKKSKARKPNLQRGNPPKRPAPPQPLPPRPPGPIPSIETPTGLARARSLVPAPAPATPDEALPPPTSRFGFSWWRDQKGGAMLRGQLARGGCGQIPQGSCGPLAYGSSGHIPQGDSSHPAQGSRGQIPQRSDSWAERPAEAYHGTGCIKREDGGSREYEYFTPAYHTGYAGGLRGVPDYTMGYAGGFGTGSTGDSGRLHHHQLGGLGVGVKSEYHGASFGVDADHGGEYGEPFGADYGGNYGEPFGAEYGNEYRQPFGADYADEHGKAYIPSTMAESAGAGYHPASATSYISGHGPAPPTTRDAMYPGIMSRDGGGPDCGANDLQPMNPRHLDETNSVKSTTPDLGRDCVFCGRNGHSTVACPERWGNNANGHTDSKTQTRQPGHEKTRTKRNRMRTMQRKLRQHPGRETQKEVEEERERLDALLREAQELEERASQLLTREEPPVDLDDILRRIIEDMR
ncbi:hypothetical protein BP00DRAFT_91062 [Aspergillus indologenus CBS 114.80]|uniref:Uncharacterized protein n=1 Tax=Aspergillus indologenus CBS 114.80 TaxID=1450541 RepID=A0A2V5JE10_9EURO|nr:hypothetical protein BP00DRAFT_91062 [Aspergillus indologenus CBS 114.80]